MRIWGFPKLSGYLVGVLIIRESDNLWVYFAGHIIIVRISYLEMSYFSTATPATETKNLNPEQESVCEYDSLAWDPMLY